MEKKKIYNINSISKNELRSLMGKKKEFFEITSVSREDLESAGFDASNVDDDTMTELAEEMADDYLEQLFWTSLKILAENLGIPKKKALEKDEDGYYHIDGAYKVRECYDCDTCEDFYSVYTEDDEFIGEIHQFEIESYNVRVDGEINEDNMLECIESMFF